MTPRFARMVENVVDDWLTGDSVAGWKVVPLTLLQREHAAVVRKVKAMRSFLRANREKLKNMKKPDHLNAEQWAESLMISDAAHTGGVATLDDLLAWLHERGR